MATSTAPPPWLSSRSPLFTFRSYTRRPFFFCKPTIITNAISCFASGSTPSLSSGSYSRRWLRTEISRHWVELEAYQPQALQEERLTVVSYNILGDRNASNHIGMYPNVDPLYLRWAHRKSVICEELVGWNPDIICLQEVDRYFDLVNSMEKAGYAGTYKRRTGDYVDGCAIFWKANEVRLIEEESIEFKALGLRDNVAQLSVFETCKGESRRFLVGNIHVLYNPHRGEVKLGQIRFLLSRAQVLAEKWGNIPIVLAGDYNSTPQSAIYKFLASSELNVMLYDKKELSGQRKCKPAQVFGIKKEIRNPFSLVDRYLDNCWTDEEVKVATGNSDCQLLLHPLKLSSSYATVKGSTATRDLNGEPLATSYHSKFLGTVDYLWYSNGVVPVRVLDTLPLNILWRTGGLPCEKLGSDHLALVSEFAFTQVGEEDTTTSTAVSAAS